MSTASWWMLAPCASAHPTRIVMNAGDVVEISGLFLYFLREGRPRILGSVSLVLACVLPQEYNYLDFSTSWLRKMFPYSGWSRQVPGRTTGGVSRDEDHEGGMSVLAFPRLKGEKPSDIETPISISSVVQPLSVRHAKWSRSPRYGSLTELLMYQL